MKPKTPLPWEPSKDMGLIRMYPEDYNFAVHAANFYEQLIVQNKKLCSSICELVDWLEDQRDLGPEVKDMLIRAREAVK